MTGLKFIRLQCNYTMKDLADALSVTKTSISQWECGKKNIPGDRLLQLSKLFGVEVRYLKGEIDDLTRQEIINMPKYSSSIHGDVHYSFSPDFESDQLFISFSDEAFETSQERREHIKKKTRILIEHITELLAVDEYTDETQFDVAYDILYEAVKHIYVIQKSKKKEARLSGIIESPLTNASVEEQVELFRNLVEAHPGMKDAKYLINRGTTEKRFIEDPDYSWEEYDME